MTLFDTTKILAAIALTPLAMTSASAETVLRLAGQHPVDHNATRVLTETIDRIEAADVGLEIKLFPAGQLGTGELVFGDVAQGVIDVGHTFVYSHNDPVLEINSLPYLVGNYEEMEKVYSAGSNFYRIFDERLANQGVTLLGVFAEGFIGVGTTEEPVSPGTTADKGMNIRVWSAEVGRLTAQELGYNTTTMNWGDVVPALQQGVVDGVIGGTAESNYTIFGDSVKYFVPYNAFVENSAFYVNTATWEGLTDEQREVMAREFARASAESFALSEKVDREYLERLSEKDISVVALSDDEIASLAAHVRETVWPAMEERLGTEIIEQIKSDLD